MIFDNPAELKERIEALSGRVVASKVPIVEDTSSYMSIASGSVLRLEGHDFFITGEAREGRFSIEDQPKLWVKYAVDLADGTRKIIKLVFHEAFTTTVGRFTVRCVRNPDKESAVLAAMAGDARFMQGRTVHDPAGNNVRVIDVINGRSLFHHVVAIEQRHERYYHETLPGILRAIVGCIEALEALHAKGLHHGDVRNDHVLIESATGQHRWIDFDLEVNYLDYDMWSVGNLLTYAVGKGIRTCRDAMKAQQALPGGGGAPICPDDSLLFFQYRLANLRKLFPYVSADLNALLLRFSTGTTDFYGSLGEVLRDVREILDRGLL